MGNRRVGGLKSLRSARSDSKPRKVPPKFAIGDNEVHGDARTRGSSGEYQFKDVPRQVSLDSLR